MIEQTGASPTCLNCGAGLVGQYCGQCGQRASNRLISLWELIRDAFGDLFEIDSRLWRTLIPLLVRPGRLTHDYLAGRRARYMPPFRMYLVLSLAFFVIAFFNPREDLAIFYEPTETSEPEHAGAQPRREVARDVLEELVREGVVDESVLGPGGPLSEMTATAEDAAADPAEDEPGAEQDTGFNIAVGDDMSCVVDNTDLDGLPEFIQRRFSAERMRTVCERVVAVGRRGVAAALLDNVPGALIILLPLMALALKFLYPLSRRYYVEHLLFFVHFHAFLFLLLTLQILWSRLIGLTAMPDFVRVVPIVALSFYIPVYLYKSMRRVYGQGRAPTVFKFLALSIAYTAGLTLMMLGALLIAVFSV